MSGHSKWHNIQAKKGKADAQRGAIGAMKRMELYFVSETHLGDEIQLHRIDAENTAVVTATANGDARPAFTAKLVW